MISRSKKTGVSWVVPAILGGLVDYATLVKEYGEAPED